MNKRQFESIFRNLTDTAKKVYLAVSETEYRTSARVINELYAQGSRIDKHIANGCLDSLVKCGVVIEQSRGLFVRSAIRETVKKQTQQESNEVKKTTTNDVSSNPVDNLLNISIRLTDFAKSIAGEIEAVAESVERNMKEGSEEAKKLYQLRDLLKGI